MSPPILVTGITGCVGRAVMRSARRTGLEVRGLARNGPAGTWPADVEVFRADVRDRGALERAAEGCNGIVHLAGWVHRHPRNDQDLAELRSSIVHGTETVAAVAAAMRIPFVMTSSIAVFGRASGSREPRPHTAYGRAKLEAETRARETCPHAVILRPAVVYGPHDRGNVSALIRAVDRRFGFVVGDGANRKAIVHADNLADRILAALQRADLAGIWVAADDPAPTQAELFREIARLLGRRPPPAVPRWPVTAAARVVDLVAKTRFRDRVQRLSESTEFPGTDLDRALGYSPRVPWPEGLRSAIVGA